VLTLEEGDVRHLHYGLFERADEAIGTAQERASTRILSQLPPPPARVLDAGSGLGTTLARLGKRYRDRYQSGEYGYRFLRFDNASRITRA
jgi:cyclopropane fatty-acyl-phospholipid synthase-like methyltransferase